MRPPATSQPSTYADMSAISMDWDEIVGMDYVLFKGPVKPEGVANLKGGRLIEGVKGAFNRVRLYIKQVILNMLPMFYIHAWTYMIVMPMLMCDWVRMNVMVMMVPRVNAAMLAATVARMRKIVTGPRTPCGRKLPWKSTW